MARERAKSFEERLPDVVPRAEADIAHLSDEMADVLYPGRRPRPCRMGVAFDSFEGPNYPRALALARRSAAYREEPAGASIRHTASFAAPEANLLRELYDIVGPIAGTDVLVDGRKVPYARELWLPLFWIFLRGETG
jgi:hypothetical protein